MLKSNVLNKYITAFKWPCELRFLVTGLHKKFTRKFQICFFFLNINYILTYFLSNPHPQKGCQQLFFFFFLREWPEQGGKEKEILLFYHYTSDSAAGLSILIFQILWFYMFKGESVLLAFLVKRFFVSAIICI